MYAFYSLGVAGARSVGGGFSAAELANAFVHTLVPIAFAYVAAHYLTLLLYQGQAIVRISSRRWASWPRTRSARTPTCSAPPTRRSTTA